MGRRDDDEFTAFVAASELRLRRAAYLICGDEGLARDVTSEALTRLYHAWPRLDRQGGESRAALRVLVTVAIDRSERSSPGALGRLDPQQRVCLVLHYVEDLPVPEVATLLGVSEGTVTSEISRGLDMLDVTTAPAEVLHAAAAAMPARYVEPHDLLTRAKARIRKRRTISLVAVGAVIVVVGTSVGLSAANDDHTQIPPNPEVIRGPVVNLSDAVTAKAGRDYTLVGTFVEHRLHRNAGRQFLTSMSGNQLLYMDGPTDRALATFGVFDPATDSSTSPPGLVDVRADGAFASDRWVIAYSSLGDMLAYDESTQQLTSLPFSDGFGADGGVIPLGFDSSGRAYVEYYASSEAGPVVWSFTPSDPSSLQQVENGGGLLAAFAGDTLVTTNGGRGDTTMLAFDTRLGATSTIPTQLPTGCSLVWLSPIGSRWLALQEDCGSRNGRQAGGQIVVLTMTGQPIVSIKGRSLRTIGSTDRFLIFGSADIHLHGNYLFSPETGKLQYLSDADYTSFTQWPPYTSHSAHLVSWGESFNSGGRVVDFFGRFD